MKFQTYFKVASYGMLVSGFMALLLTWQIDPVTLGLYGLALGLGWFRKPGGSTVKPSRPLLNALVVFYAAFFVLDYFALSHDFRMAAIRLLFFVTIVKLYTLRSDRDYMYLFITSFLQLLVSTTLTISLSFLAALIAFLISSIATLILFEIKRTARRIQRARAPRREPGTAEPIAAIHHLGAHHIWSVTLVLAFFILILAVPIFFIIPRLSIGLLAQPLEQPQLISGFSDRVRLGEIGSIKQNPAVVMRVKVKGVEALPAHWKWRGMALDRYDGHTWTQSPDPRVSLNARRMSWTGNQRVFSFRPLDERSKEHILEQTILLEPLSTNVLFTAGQVTEIVSSDIISLMADSAGALTLTSPPLTRLRYTVRALPVGNHGVDWSRAAPRQTAKYLSLPPELDPRIGQLAAAIAQNQAASYGKAQAIETYLKGKYAYTLDLKGRRHMADPLAHFLFTTQAGHCEYFASAMVIMLRRLQIPSRIINGFRLGEFNELGGDYIVRQSDAHSWVEAYFPEHGWVEFDPTPPDPAPARNPVRQWFFQLADALELFWADQVINYDLWRQAQAIAEALKSLRAFESAVGELNRQWVQILQKKLTDATVERPALSLGKPVLIGVAGLVALIALGIWLRRRPWIFSYTARGRQNVAVSLYSDMLRILRRYGIEKPKHQTPREFCRVLDQRKEAGYLWAITEAYHKARYSRVTITPDELRLMDTYLRQLKDSLKSGVRTPN